MAEDICRTCLNKDTQLRYINSSITIAGKDINLTYILQTFYDYTVDECDGLPQSICINCVHHLTLTYSFKVLVEANAKILLDHTTNCQEDSTEYIDNVNDFNTFEINDDQKYYTRKLKKCQGLIYCVECKNGFQSSKNLYDHCVNAHPAPNKSGRDCEFCNRKFEDFRSMIIHRGYHFSPFFCEKCWIGFKEMEDLAEHTCHSKYEELLEQTKAISQCDKVMTQCDICGKSYPKTYIKIHMLIHSDNPKYACKYCPKKFKVPCSLNSHTLWVHKKTRNYVCDICHASFITASSKSTHIRKHHLKEKKYVCDTCEKRFFSKSEVDRHSLTHTGEKNFRCEMCDKAYQTRFGLKTHLKSHNNLI